MSDTSRVFIEEVVEAAMDMWEKWGENVTTTTQTYEGSCSEVKAKGQIPTQSTKKLSSRPKPTKATD